MRETIRAGGLLRCDFPRCPAVFVTYSRVSLTRLQARDVDWARMSGRKISGGEPGIFLSNKKVDLCPAHSNPEPYTPPPKAEKKPSPKRK